MTHWERCVGDVIRYAAGLRCNESAVDGLVRSYLEAPAFYPEWRRDLHDIAMKALAHKKSSS